MADHLRKQIRAAALVALTGLDTTGDNAFASRVDPLSDAELPAVLIDTLDEQIQTASMGGPDRDLERSLQLTVRGCAKHATGYQDVVDAIAKEVETALAGDNGLGGLCKYIEPTSQNTSITGDGETPVAVCTMLFTCFYMTALNAPDVPR